MFTIAYKKPKCLEGVRLIPQLRMILMYCVVNDDLNPDLFFLFSAFQHPVRMDHKRKNNPDRFCYICSDVVLPNCQAKITDFVKKAYRVNFKVKLRDQDKPFAPDVYCKTCAWNSKDWRTGKRKSMLFDIPMVRRERKDHITDCYFCVINLKGINSKNKYYVHYPAAIRPIPHGPDPSVPEPGGNIVIWLLWLGMMHTS